MATPPSPREPSLIETYREALSGSDVGRLIGLSDGVFGFAITFLVVTLVVPLSCLGGDEERCLVGYLAAPVQVDTFLAYAFAFFVLGIWWVRHHVVFHFIARYNVALLWANLLFLLTIAVTPFVLGVFALYIGVEIAVVLFGLVEAAAGLLLLLAWEVALRFDLVEETVTPTLARRVRLQGVIAPVIFLVSAGVATFSVTAAHFVWGALFVEIVAIQVAAMRGGPKRSRPPTSTRAD